MTATFSQITFSEYLLLPYDGRRTELVNGKIIEMSEASPLHVDIIDFLMELLKAHILAEGLDLVVRAGTGIEIPRESGFNNARDPDLVVCQRQQWRAMRHLTKAVFLSGNGPSLAIEVVSPGNSTVDTADKRQEYALAGVPEYWIVNPVDG
ncbi:MAG: Uma2 family endonuclease [Cyanobacteria bacterium J06554_6]